MLGPNFSNACFSSLQHKVNAELGILLGSKGGTKPSQEADIAYCVSATTSQSYQQDAMTQNWGQSHSNIGLKAQEEYITRC